MWFELKDSDYISSTSKFWALTFQVGVKYFPLDKAAAGLFFSTELGIMVTKRETIYHNFDSDFLRTYTDLSVDPGIGYRLGNVKPSFRLQFNLSDAGFNCSISLFYNGPIYWWGGHHGRNYLHKIGNSKCYHTHAT